MTQRAGTDTVCIVGRPNVGKSSLFNRLVGQRQAVVYQEAGTTRDRVRREMSWNQVSFGLCDTGGYVAADNDKMSKHVKSQIKQALSEADVILFVCDITTGLLPLDEELVPLVRTAGKPIFLVVNKVDNEELLENMDDFYSLGLGQPYPVSAIHNRGIVELLDDVAKKVRKISPEAVKPQVDRIVILGRPNVGKSSYLNALLNAERVIVDDKPGTTRDTVDIPFEHNGTKFTIIDTAGIRHKRKIKEAVDMYSIIRAKETLGRADAAIVMIDSYDGLRQDDIKVIEMVLGEGKGCVLAVNKWDLINNMPMEAYKETLIDRARFLNDVPIVFTSCTNMRNILKPIEAMKKVMDSSRLQIKNDLMQELIRSFRRMNLPCGKKGSRIGIHYISQIGIHPPRFLVFVNKASLVNESFDNFVKKEFKARFDLLGVPIRIEYKSKDKEKRD